MGFRRGSGSFSLVDVKLLEFRVSLTPSLISMFLLLFSSFFWSMVASALSYENGAEDKRVQFWFCALLPVSLCLCPCMCQKYDFLPALMLLNRTGNCCFNHYSSAL